MWAEGTSLCTHQQLMARYHNESWKTFLLSLVLGWPGLSPLDSLQELQTQTELNCFSWALLKDAQVLLPRSEDGAAGIKLLQDLGTILPSLNTHEGKLSHTVFVLISLQDLIFQSEKCHHFWFVAILGKRSPWGMMLQSGPFLLL